MARKTSFLMPFVPASSVERPPAAIENEAIETRSDAARLGDAMHSLLEHGAVDTADAPIGAPSAWLARAAREFELDAEQVRQAAALARRIRTGDGRWAWDDGVIDWQGNEVTLIHRGDTLRLDRLVHRRDTGEWWVLDFKSADRPEEQPALVEQLIRYREAVQTANPGAVVRVAFLTGEGRVVEVGSA